MSLRRFFESPQNRTGVSIWVGTAITALVQQFAFHQALTAADLLGLILGILKILEPESTATLAQLQKTVADVKSLVSLPNTESLAGVVLDAGEFVKAIEN